MKDYDHRIADIFKACGFSEEEESELMDGMDKIIKSFSVMNISNRVEAMEKFFRSRHPRFSVMFIVKMLGSMYEMMKGKGCGTCPIEKMSGTKRVPDELRAIVEKMKNDPKLPQEIKDVLKTGSVEFVRVNALRKKSSARNPDEKNVPAGKTVN